MKQITCAQRKLGLHRLAPSCETGEGLMREAAERKIPPATAVCEINKLVDSGAYKVGQRFGLKNVFGRFRYPVEGPWVYLKRTKQNTGIKKCVCFADTNIEYSLHWGC
jgi:hypothetical protein